MAKVAIVDPSYPVDYSKLEVPPTYKCSGCGATGCKLWREYQTFLDHQTLLCARCTAISQKKDISSIGDDGKHMTDDGCKTDSIGWYVPAVPTEENNTYWGYSSVPQEGCDWWIRLPTLLPN